MSNFLKAFFSRRLLIRGFFISAPEPDLTMITVVVSNADCLNSYRDPHRKNAEDLGDPMVGAYNHFTSPIRPAPGRHNL